jgi:hypothetical protein
LGEITIKREPKLDSKKANIMTFFSLKTSSIMPAGMDINPYAMKKAKGNKDTMVRLK